MSNTTENLGLFKYDPIADKDQKFSIDQALNQNWDKVDTEVQNLKSSVSEGKSLIAAAVTDKGVNTAADASFATMAGNIDAIELGVILPELTNPAGAGNIDSGYQAIDGNGTLISGTSTKVTLPTLSNPAEEAQILNTYDVIDATGAKITGSMKNRGNISATISPGESYTVLEGYHKGQGTVTASGKAVETKILKCSTTSLQYYCGAGQAQVINTMFFNIAEVASPGDKFISKDGKLLYKCESETNITVYNDSSNNVSFYWPAETEIYKIYPL